MNANNPTAASLISSRNILLGGRVNEHVLPCLAKIIDDIDFIAVLGTRNVVRYCVNVAMAQIQESEYVSAGRIINLIHNLPLSEEERPRWDVDYFLSVELRSFLDHFDEILDSRKIFLYICDQIGAIHSVNDANFL